MQESDAIGLHITTKFWNYRDTTTTAVSRSQHYPVKILGKSPKFHAAKLIRTFTVIIIIMPAAKNEQKSCVEIEN